MLMSPNQVPALGRVVCCPEKDFQTEPDTQSQLYGRDRCDMSAVLGVLG